MPLPAVATGELFFRIRWPSRLLLLHSPNFSIYAYYLEKH